MTTKEEAFCSSIPLFCDEKVLFRIVALSHSVKRLMMLDHLFGDADHRIERYIQLGRAA